MGRTPQYSLSNIEKLLPITNRNAMLKWLKVHYIKAQDALAVGFDGAPVIQKGDYVATAEDIVNAIDIKRGHIDKNSARFLIRLFYSGAMPSVLIVQGKDIDPDFYYFAFPGSFSQQA